MGFRRETVWVPLAKAQSLRATKYTFQSHVNKCVEQPKRLWWTPLPIVYDLARIRSHTREGPERQAIWLIMPASAGWNWVCPAQVCG
jgi:hypothetical protein